MAEKVTPDLFFTETPPQRIIGTECEYEVQRPGSVRFYDYINPRTLSVAGLREFNTYLDNGGRLYFDVGNLEYDTPECLGPREAAIADLAGARVMATLVSVADKEGTSLYRHAGTYLHQRVEGDGEMVNITGETKGYHENFMFPRSISQDNYIERLIPSYLASRLWAMQGTIREDFVFSQKAWGVGGDALSYNLGRRTTHGNKPMAIIPPPGNDADVLGDPGWARLEVRFAEPGLSPVTRYLGLAATSLALRLIEHQDVIGHEFFEEIELADPVEAARLFATDLEMKKTAETVEGKSVTALDIQEQIIDVALALSQIIELPADEVEAACMLYGIIEQLRVCNPVDAEYGELNKILDFAAKHYYLHRKLGPGNMHRENPEAVLRAFAWDRLVPTGLGMQWWSKVDSGLIPEEEINRAQFEAPKTTRAGIRAYYIGHMKTSLTKAMWSGVELDGKRYRSLANPYEAPY